jgi:lysophospholipid acyltransferase (LPLAT)-like uncharacterized protein
MPSFKRIFASAAFQSIAGSAAAWYLRLVWYTSRKIYDPANVYDLFKPPVIATMWHGQHFMAPFIKPNDDDYRAKVLISRHRDGEFNAIVAQKLGIGTIRGSGAHNGEFHRKGGLTAFSEMLDALDEGYSVALTADVPKISRISGMGVVKLAQRSGKPIVAVAVATHNRIVLKNWDRSAINLPFGRMVLVGSPPISVPVDADAATLEAARQFVESELNRVTARAYEIADRPRSTKP